MERGDNGYMRVVAGMPDPGDRLPASARRRLKVDERRALVERLRHQGWSYRRISDELNISYSVVSGWLDGPEAASPPLAALPIRRAAPRHPTESTIQRTLPSAESESTPPLLEHLIAQNQALLQRVDHLVAAEAVQRQAVANLEMRLVCAIEDQHKKLGERLIDSVKLLLRKILPR